MTVAYHALQISAVHVTGAGNNAVNVFHVAPQGLWPGLDKTDMANDAIARLTTYYTSLITNGCIVPDWTIGSSVLELQEGDPSEFIPATPSAVAGSMSGSYQPNQLAVVVSWRTALAGKSYRGRTFHGPITSNMVSGTGMNPTGRNNLQTAVNALVAGLASDNLDLVVLSKVAHASTPVVSGYVDATIDTLRSRAA